MTLKVSSHQSKYWNKRETQVVKRVQEHYHNPSFTNVIEATLSILTIIK